MQITWSKIQRWCSSGLYRSNASVSAMLYISLESRTEVCLKFRVSLSLVLLLRLHCAADACFHYSFSKFKSLLYVSVDCSYHIHLVMSGSAEFITATVFAVIMVLIGLGAIWIVRWQTYFLLRHQGESPDVGFSKTVAHFLFVYFSTLISSRP
jgi:hypothetical protein